MSKIDDYDSEDDNLKMKTEIVSNQPSILNKIISIQEEFYNQNKKNKFFKKNQKIDCAKEICTKIDINEMIAESIHVINQTNQIYIDYPIFKLYANPDNFDIIITHIINTCRYLVTYYKNFQVYINLQGLTISAVERYKDIIKKYVSCCLNENTDFAILMTKLHILNSPSVIEMIVKIVKPIIDSTVAEKVCFYNKDESLQIINKHIKKI